MKKWWERKGREKEIKKKRAIKKEKRTLGVRFTERENKREREIKRNGKQTFLIKIIIESESEE